MYFGRQNVGMYDPIDTKKVQWGVGTLGRETGMEMDKSRQQVEAQDSMAARQHAQQMASAAAQEQHERALQAQEQQRRAYESETARMGQQQKYGLLGGLIGGGVRRFGDVRRSRGL